MKNKLISIGFFLLVIINLFITNINVRILAQSDTSRAKEVNNMFILGSSNINKDLLVMVIILSIICLIIIAINIIQVVKRFNKGSTYIDNNINSILFQMCTEINEFNLQNNERYIYSLKDEKFIKTKSEFDLRESLEIFDKRSVYPDDIDNYMSNFNFDNLLKIALNEEKSIFNFRMKDDTGLYKSYLVLLQGAHYNNIPIVMMYKHDVTVIIEEQNNKNKQLLATLKLSEATNDTKTKFIAKMSYDLRNSLNVVVGYMQLVMNNKDDVDKIFECVSKADIATRELISVVDSLMDMNDVKTGETTISKKEFDFKALITSISEACFNKAVSKNINFDCKLIGVTEEFLIGDKKRVNQVLNKILLSVLQITPIDSKVLFSIKQEKISDKIVHMKFVINGFISEDKMSEVITFINSSADMYNIHSLELSIIKNIISLMDGKLEVKSDNSELLITIDLPFSVVEVNELKFDEAVFEDVYALVINDEYDVCEFMSILLYNCGVRNDKAYEHEEAIDKIKKANGKYNLILLDYNFNNASGISFVQELRKLVDKNVLIVMCAYKIDEIMEEATNVGVDVIIPKPLFHSSILDVLVNNFNRYKIDFKTIKKNYDFKGNKVLLVEDNEMNIEIAKDILLEMGFSIVTAFNGQEAVKTFLDSKVNEFDIILMDINMPTMDGYRATDIIRRSDHPNAKIIPILAMTANVFPEDINRALVAGMNDHVSKPINIEVLFSVLNKYLKSKK